MIPMILGWGTADLTRKDLLYKTFSPISLNSLIAPEHTPYL